MRHNATHEAARRPLNSRARQTTARLSRGTASAALPHARAGGEQRSKLSRALQSAASLRAPRLSAKQVETLLSVRDFARREGFPASDVQLAAVLGVVDARGRADSLARKGLLARSGPRGQHELTPLGGAVASMFTRTGQGAVLRFEAPVRRGPLMVFSSAVGR